MFTADNEQIPHFAGPIVSDVDDPFFRPREVELLQHPNLKAYVVTADRAGRRFQDLGVDKPYHVIPQGISLSSVKDEPGRRGGRAPGTGRDRRRLDGRIPAERRGPRRRRAALQRRPPARALGRDPLEAPERPALARRGGERPDQATRRGQGRHCPLRPSSARAGTRDRRELRHRPLSANGGHGDPGRQGRRVHRAWRPDRLVRLRGDGEPARDWRGPAGSRRRESSPTRSSTWARTTRRGSSSQPRRSEQEPLSTGTCSPGGTRTRSSTGTCPRG